VNPGVNAPVHALKFGNNKLMQAKSFLTEDAAAHQCREGEPRERLVEGDVQSVGVSGIASDDLNLKE